MEMENGEEIVDKKAHANLLKELKSINGKPKKIGREKVVRVSSDFKPFLDLNFALKKIGDQKLLISSKKLHALPKPLEKPVAKRLKRAAGYEKVAIDANKWEGIVNQRRKADQLVFPLEQSKLTLVETKQSSKASSQTPLEQEIYSLLNGAKLIKEKETEEDQRIRKAMTLEEIKLKSREIWRRKLLHMRLEKKASLLNKSKSRKYHRILRRERVRKKKEEFERLKEKDPEAALMILEDLEKTRITERMSLRHKNSRWLKTQKARLGQDQTAKDSLVENADMRKQLLEKLKPPGDEEDDFEELLKEQEDWISSGAVDASNRWVSQLALPQGEGNEREEDTSFYKTKMFWEEFHKRKIQELQAQREVRKREEEMEEKNNENNDARVEEEFTEDGGGSDIEENEGTEEKVDDEVDDDDDESEQEEEEVEEEEECTSGSHKENERKKDSNSLKLRKSLKEKKEYLTSSSSAKKEKNTKMKVTENGVKKNKIGTKAKQETKKMEKGVKNSKPKENKRKLELEENNSDLKLEAKKRKMEKKVKLQEKKSCKAGKLKKDGSEAETKKDKSDGKKKLKTTKSEGKKNCTIGKLKKEGSEAETKKDISESKKKLKSKKRKVSPCEDPVPEVFIDDIFDRGEENLASKVKEKLAKRKVENSITKTKTTGRKSKLKKADSTSEEPPAVSPSHEMEFDFTAKKDSNPDHETVTRVRTMEDMDSIPTPERRVKKLLSNATKEEQEEATSKEAPTTVHLQDGNITKIKSRRLGGAYPDYSYLKGLKNMDDDSDSEEEGEEDLQDLFEDDDNIKEFREEKKSQEEAEAPKDINLFLHGWGRWSGPGIKPSEKLKKRFKIKAPRQRQNKYSSVGNVIYNEKNDVHQNIRKLMVSELPAPFTSVKNFEASIRQPIGRKFVPEASHRKLIAPPVVLKMGSVIEPMGEEALLADHEAKQGKLKLEKKINKELSKIKGVKSNKTSRNRKGTTRRTKSINKNLKVKTLSIIK